MATIELNPNVDVRRAEQRFTSDFGWLDSKHSFSFGHHHDPANTHHGLLLVNNDDVVDPGTGFETHPHRDMEIVTWVLQGSLVHQDSTGHNGVIYPGLAQRMSAGRGIYHSEKNNTSPRDVRLIQMWVPDTRSRAFKRRAHLDSLAIANSQADNDDQAFVDAISIWPGKE